MIASVSLGAERIFTLRTRPGPKLGRGRRTRAETFAVPLEHGSLLVMRGDTQKNWWHSVQKTEAVAAGRVNLTFRRIL